MQYQISGGLAERSSRYEGAGIVAKHEELCIGVDDGKPSIDIQPAYRTVQVDGAGLGRAIPDKIAEIDVGGQPTGGVGSSAQAGNVATCCS